MQGATGLGKTHLSLAIARAAIGKGFGVIYCSAPNIIGKLEKERFRSARGSADESDVYLLECDLLILDDLGTEFHQLFQLHDLQYDQFPADGLQAHHYQH